MFKLFKAAFRSLKSVKITILGLSILILLSSSVFTMLADVRHAYDNTFNKYDKVSNLHDLTVDLDVNNEGNLYNGGFVKTLEEHYVLESSEGYRKSLKHSGYEPFDVFGGGILDTDGNNVIPTTDVVGENTIRTNVFDVNDFLSYFKKFNDIEISGSFAEPEINFDLLDGTFIPSKDVNLNRKKVTTDNDTLLSDSVTMTNEYRLTSTDTLTFDKQYYVNDVIDQRKVGGFANSDRNNLLFEFNKLLYINVVTKEASFDQVKGNDWTLTGEGIAIGANRFNSLNYPEHLFGMHDKSYSSTGNAYNLTTNGNNHHTFWAENSKLISSNRFEKSSQGGLISTSDWGYKSGGNEAISRTFTLPTSFENKIVNKNVSQVVLKKGIEYNIPLEWIQNIRNETYYIKHSYDLTYNAMLAATDGRFGDWTGAYAEYMQTLTSYQIEELRKIYYWSKVTVTEGEDTNGESEYNALITPADANLKIRLSREKYFNDPVYDPNGVHTVPITTTDTTISKEENLPNQSTNRQQFLFEFNKITNANIRSEKLSEISLGASTITRNKLTDFANELVGEENVGRRQTMTISSFDKTQNKSQVFQFVNSSKEINKNVDKLYYESLYPTELLTIDSTKGFNDNWGIPDSPPSSYSLSMINSIFRGYHIDKDYYDVDVDFAELNGKADTKIVKLTNAKKEIKGITKDLEKEEEEYILLNKSGDEWVEESRLDSNQLQMFLANPKDQYTIKGEVGDKGVWYSINTANSSIFVPVEYKNIPNVAIAEATLDNTYYSFLQPIISGLTGILSQGSNPWISAEVLEALSTGLNNSFSNNYFYTVLQSGNIDKAQMGKIFFDMFYEANKSSVGQPMAERIFTEIIDHIIVLVQQQPTRELQLDYLTTELSKVSTLFKNVFQLDISAFIDIWTDMSPYVENPIEFLESFKLILTSIDTNVWFESIHNWYETNYDGIAAKPLTNDAGDFVTQDGKYVYSYLGTRELLTYMFSSIDITEFRTATDQLVDSINMDKVMEKLFDDSTVDLNDFAKSQVRNLFDELKINGNYSNIGNLMKGLLNTIDIRAVGNHIYNSYTPIIFEKEVDGETKVFSAAHVTNVNMAAAIAKGLFANDDNFNRIISLITNNINVSYDVENAISIPGWVPVIGGEHIANPIDVKGKLDLYDLQGLETISYNKVENWDKINTAYLAGTSLSANDKDILIKALNKHFDVNLNIALSGKEEIDKYSLMFREIVNQLKLQQDYKGYVATGPATGIGSDIYGSNLSPQSLADVALWSIKPGEGEFDIDIGALGIGVSSSYMTFEGAYGAVSKIIQSSEYAAGSNSLSMYNYWIKMIYTFADKLVKENNYSEDNALYIAADMTYQVAALSWENTEFQNILLAQKEGLGGGTIANISKISEIPTSLVKVGEVYESLFDEVLNTESFGRTLNSLDPMVYQYLLNDKENFIIQSSMQSWAKQNSSKSPVWKRFGDSTHWVIQNLAFGSKPNSRETSLNLANGSLDILRAMSSISDEFAAQTDFFLIAGLSPAIASTYLGVSFPITAKYLTVSNSQDSGNIGYVISNHIKNLGKEPLGWFANQANDFIEEEWLAFEVEQHGTVPLELDMYYLDYLDAKIQDENSLLFDLPFSDLFNITLGNSTETYVEENQIKFLNVGAYVAKLSESYLLANNKKEYKEKLPENIDDMLNLINTIDEDYLINVNNQKFVILGRENAIDYLYPVIDAANINVDTANQAVVFVNQFGFDRVIQANQATAIKDYLVLKRGNYNGKSFNVLPQIDQQSTNSFSDKLGNVSNVNMNMINKYKTTSSFDSKSNIVTFNNSLTGLRDAFNYYIDSNNLAYTQKAYLADESDPLNPERAIRVATIQGVISSITQMQFYGVLALVIMVGMITIFVSKRYIDNRRVVIGILRAQGYNKWKIGFSFTPFGLCTALIGGVIGYLIGHFMQVPFMNSFASFWTVPTDLTTFNWVSMVITVFVPIVGISAIIVLSTVFSLRKKPIELMSSASESSNGWFSRMALKPFKKFSIITRFRSTIAFNSIFKMLSLSFAISLSSFVGMFSVASAGVFERAVSGTYDQRKYTFNMDLTTPTIEGGGYDLIDRHDIDALAQLYVPVGSNLESNVNVFDYFKPGPSAIMDLDQTTPTEEGRAHILSKSSLDVIVAASIAANPWEIAKNALPDSQYVSALELTAAAGKKLEESQDVPARIRNRENYYQYISQENNNGYFQYKIWNQKTLQYESKRITTKDREEYKEFLQTAYQEAEIKDYFMIYGGVDIDESIDETYSWAKVTIKSDPEALKITGIKSDSKFINPITESKSDIKASLQRYEDNNKPDGTQTNPFPIAINEVVRRRKNLSVNDVFKIEAQNTTGRYYSEIDETFDEQTQNYVRVIAINSTYINNEIIGLQSHVNEMINLNDAKWRDGILPFNGVFTNDEKPNQALESLLLYSTSGYWAAIEGIKTDTMDPRDEKVVFQNIFGPDGSFDQVKSSTEDSFVKQTAIDNFISKYVGNATTYDQVWNSGSPDDLQVDAVLRGFNSVYGKTVFSSAIFAVGAKDIEAGFVQNITKTVDSITFAFVSITVAVSIIALIIISTMIINENKKKIATFSVMGYSEREKIKMFMYVYIPFILIAIIASIPIAYGLVSLFNNVVLTTSTIALPLVLTWVDMLVSTIVISLVFVVTISFAYMSLRKIKAIYILQGDD